MNQAFDTQDFEKVDSNMTILHSRFAEVRRSYRGSKEEVGAIPLNHAHPNIDYKDRFALFHNGFIANFDELKQDISPALFNRYDTKCLTDSQVVTALIAAEMDKNLTLKEALKNVVEQKLLGTYRIAVMEITNPTCILFVKNSGDFSFS